MPLNEPASPQGVGGQPTDWTSVDSGLIKLVAFANDTKTLYIRFKNDALWRYNAVPYETYKSLVYAGSSGRYFRTNVLNKFVGEKVNDIAAGPEGTDNPDALQEPGAGAQCPVSSQA